MWRLRFACVLAILGLMAPATQATAEGESVNGYPNWSERVLYEWMNRARSDPQADLAGCPSGQCLEAACYSSASPPRYLDQALAHSSRFHADHLMINSYFDHPSHCTLVNSISTLYPDACAGSASCSCTQGALTTSSGTWTSPFSRMAMFGAQVSAAGEIIAAGYAGPVATFYGWLYEPASTSSCGFTQANGHRYLILVDGYGPGAGAGYVTNPGTYPSYSSYAAMDFAGTAGDTYKIPSGSHYPRQASSVDAWANWYDAAAPATSAINVDGVCSAMTLARGTATNGAWHATVSGVGSGCHRYFFAFIDSAGKNVLYPTSGSLAIGDGSAQCPDYSSIAPPSCPGFERILTSGFDP